MPLSDTARSILTEASQHPLGIADPPATLPAAARQAVLRSLLRQELVPNTRRRPTIPVMAGAMAEAPPEAASAHHWRRCLPLRCAAGDPLRRRRIPRADRLERDDIDVLAEKFHQMAVEAGRDAVSLPITVFRVPEALDKLVYCDDIDIDRAVFSLPAEGRDTLLPIIDRRAEFKLRLDR
jgi:hypothetical protein